MRYAYLPDGTPVESISQIPPDRENIVVCHNCMRRGQLWHSHQGSLRPDLDRTADFSSQHRVEIETRKRVLSRICGQPGGRPRPGSILREEYGPQFRNSVLITGVDGPSDLVSVVGKLRAVDAGTHKLISIKDMRKIATLPAAETREVPGRKRRGRRVEIQLRLRSMLDRGTGRILARPSGSKLKAAFESVSTEASYTSATEAHRLGKNKRLL